MGLKNKFKKLNEKIKERFLQPEFEGMYSFIEEKNALSKSFIRNVALLFSTAVTGAIAGYIAYENWRNRDSDGDGIKDVDEEKYGTNHHSRDTDNDGISDYDEIFKFHTNPVKADSDNDGISDYDEIFVYNLNPNKPNPNVSYALSLGLKDYYKLFIPLDNDATQDNNEKEFVGLVANNKEILIIPTYFNYLKDEVSDGIITNDELKHSTNFSHLVKGLYDVVISEADLNKNDPNLQISDPIKTIDYSSNLGLKLGFDKNFARDATIKAIGYYGIAVNDRKLPEHYEAITLLTKGTQIEKYGDNLVDFEPIVFKNVYYREIGDWHSPLKHGDVIIGSYDKARDTWMIAELLKRRPELVDQPKKFEWINKMMQEVSFCIFDDPWGPKKYGEYYKPTDEVIWKDVILPFHDYMDNLPKNLQRDGLPIALHYWDSDLLDQEIQDKTNRTIALYYLSDLPAQFIKPGDYYIDENGNWVGREITGIEAMKSFINLLPEEYNKIASLYPWGKVKIDKYYISPFDHYYDWLHDRYHNGLSNTVTEFLGGWDEDKAHATYPRKYDWLENYNGVDQYLTKEWNAWRLIKFTVAFPKEYEEVDAYKYGIPLDFRAFGIPEGITRETGPPGIGRNWTPDLVFTMNPEWSVSLPDNIVRKLKNEFEDKELVIGYGNYFGLYSLKGGLLKDSYYFKYLSQSIRDKNIILWMKG